MAKNKPRLTFYKGGPRSGHHGHRGLPGVHGGSRPSGKGRGGIFGTRRSRSKKKRGQGIFEGSGRSRRSIEGESGFARDNRKRSTTSSLKVGGKTYKINKGSPPGVRPSGGFRLFSGKKTLHIADDLADVKNYLEENPGKSPRIYDER